MQVTDPRALGTTPADVELLSRRTERRRLALEALRQHGQPGWHWRIGIAILWCCALMLPSRFGADYSAYLGLTPEGLAWTSLALAGLMQLAFVVFTLDRRVLALTQLVTELLRSEGERR